MNVRLPYGHTHLDLEVNDKNLKGILYPKEIRSSKTDGEYIMEALASPMGTLPLSDLAKHKKTAAIAVDDYTRPCPTRTMLPFVLEELYENGINKKDIIIIFASGTHRPVRDDEAEMLLGSSIAHEINYISNQYKGEDFTYVGTTSRGTEVRIKNAFLDADLQILLGDVEMHYFSGYGGGRKTILPGLSHYSTIQHNYKHNLFHPNSRAGVLDGNPIFENQTEGARLVQPDFCLNVVQNHHNEIIGAYGGDFDIVLRKGANLVDKMYKIKIDEPADILVIAADGAPHDINLYQAAKAVALNSNAVKQSGCIILVAQCAEGHGSQEYYDWIRRYTSLEEVIEELKKEFIPGGHKAYYQLSVQKKAHWIMVTDISREIIEKDFRLEYAKSVELALSRAYEYTGKDSSVIVIPKGTTTLVEVNK